MIEIKNKAHSLMLFFGEQKGETQYNMNITFCTWQATNGCQKKCKSPEVKIYFSILSVINTHHLLFIISWSFQTVPEGILSTELHLILRIDWNLFHSTIQNVGVSPALAILSSSIVIGGKDGLLHAWMRDFSQLRVALLSGGGVISLCWW